MYATYAGATRYLLRDKVLEASLRSPNTVRNILFTGCICYIRATHFNHGLFFFAIRYSAFKVPIGVDSDKTKPVYLLLLLYLTIHKKKSAPNGHFENFDFGSGGASLNVFLRRRAPADLSIACPLSC